MRLALEHEETAGAAGSTRCSAALPGRSPSEAIAAVAADGIGRRTVPIDLIERNPRNPRRDFPPDQLDELAASLKQHGIVQPIVVRPLPGEDERYEIIAGERRWRAAQLAGLHDVPVTILDVPDREALELAIVENVQRADLNPVEEARGYQALIEEFHYSQADLGDDDRQEPRACDQHAAAAEAAAGGARADGGRGAVGRPRPRAARRPPIRKRWRSSSWRRTFRCARRSGWRRRRRRSRGRAARSGRS